MKRDENEHDVTLEFNYGDRMRLMQVLFQAKQHVRVLEYNDMEPSVPEKMLNAWMTIIHPNPFDEGVTYSFDSVEAAIKYINDPTEIQ